MNTESTKTIKTFNEFLQSHTGELIRAGNVALSATDCLADPSEFESPLVSVFLAQPSASAIAGLVAIMSEGDTLILPHLRWSEQQQLTAANAVREVVEAMPTDDSFRTIVFSSGSEGKPKAILHTWANHMHSALASNKRVGFSKGDVWLHTLPVYHVGGLSIVMRAVVGGGTIALPPQDLPFEQAVADTEFTHISLVPTQLYRLMANEKSRARLAQATCVLVGGAPLSKSLATRALEANVPVFVTYGCTEAASQVATSRLSTAKDLSAEPLEGYSLSVQNTELVLESPSLGMFLDEQHNFTAIKRHCTGDVGTVEHGRVQVIGRKDNMFISGGENIHAETVEGALLQCENVHEAYVVPIESAEFGQRPMAFVSVDGELNEEDIKASVAQRLPSFMVPVYIAEIPEYTRTGIKVSRMKLTAYASSYASFSRE